MCQTTKLKIGKYCFVNYMIKISYSANSAMQKEYLETSTIGFCLLQDKEVLPPKFSDSDMVICEL